MNCGRCNTQVVMIEPHPDYFPNHTGKVLIDFDPDLGHGNLFLCNDNGNITVAKLSGQDLQNVRMVGLPTYTAHDCKQHVWMPNS